MVDGRRNSAAEKQAGCALTNSSLPEQICIRGLVSSKHFFFDNSKEEKCETVDIHSEVPRHVETVVLMSRA